MTKQTIDALQYLADDVNRFVSHVTSQLDHVPETPKTSEASYSTQPVNLLRIDMSIGTGKRHSLDDARI